MEELTSIESEGNSKTRLTNLLSQAKNLEDSGIPIFNRIEDFTYLFFISSRGGKSYTYDTYLKLAYESELKSDKQVGNENFCDAIVVHEARSRLIAVTDYVLREEGFPSEVTLGEHEKETQGRFEAALAYRGYHEAGVMAEDCENEHPFIQRLLRSYAKHATVKFLFDDLDIPNTEKDIQYYDVAMRAFLKGKERSKGFPRLADRILFGWLTKDLPSEEISKIMQLSVNLLRFRAGYNDPEYFRKRKFNTFLRTIIAEDIHRHIPNRLLKFRVPYALKKTPVLPPDPRDVEEFIQTESFYSIHALFKTLPLSMIDIFRSVALDKQIDFNSWSSQPARQVISEGLRVIKGMLLIDFEDCDASNLLLFSSENYYDNLRERMLSKLNSNYSLDN